MSDMGIEQTVERWDNGETIWTVEMGGLGPGYEQAIQILMVEILRWFIDRPTDWDNEEWRKEANDRIDKEVVHVVNAWPGCGFSGAQVGAAKSLACAVVRKGWEQVFKEVADARESDDKILVSKGWPHSTQEVTDE